MLNEANRGNERAQVNEHGKRVKKDRCHRKGWTWPGWNFEKLTLEENDWAEVLPFCVELHLEAEGTATHAMETSYRGERAKEGKGKRRLAEKGREKVGEMRHVCNKIRPPRKLQKLRRKKTKNPKGACRGKGEGEAQD